MPDNITAQEATAFASAMSQLAAEGAGQKGYIKKTKTESGYTYQYIQPGQSTSGKMGAKDIAATANRIAQYGRSNISERGLSGSDLKHIQQGMARLKFRMENHKPSLFQSMKKLAAIANQILQPNYKTDLENAIKERPAPILTPEDNNAIVKEYQKGIGESLINERNKKIIEKFNSENAVLKNKLESFNDKNNESYIAAAQANKSLIAAYQASPDRALLDIFKAKTCDNLTEICAGKNLPDVEYDLEFVILLSKYRETFPAEAQKTDVALVREITGLTTFNEFGGIQEFARPLEKPLSWFKENLSKMGVDVTWNGVKLVVKLVGKAGQLLESGLDLLGTGIKWVGKLFTSKSKSKGEKASSKQVREAASSVASSSQQPKLTMGERLASMVFKEEAPVSEDNCVFNLKRRIQFNSIVARTGIIKSDNKYQQKSFVTYLRKSVWGAFVGNVGGKTKEQIQTQAPTSEQGKRELEGESSIAHMFYMYNLLETGSKTNQSPKTTQLREDLERSLPFAFEASVIGGNKERENILSHQIYEKLGAMEVGQSLYLPIGCDGHATLLMMTKTAEGRVQVQHFNTGLGILEQRRLAGDDKFSLRNLWNGPGGFPIAVGFEVDLTRTEVQTNLEAALAYFINTASYEETTMEEVTRGLVKLNDLTGTGKGIEATVRRDKSQQTGNCSYRCLMEGARDRLGASDYRKFKTSYTNQLEADLRDTVKIKRNSSDDLLLQDLSLIRGRTGQKQAAPIQQTQETQPKKSKRRNRSSTTKIRKGIKG